MKVLRVGTTNFLDSLRVEWFEDRIPVGEEIFRTIHTDFAALQPPVQWKSVISPGGTGRGVALITYPT
jgi:hypothetical protein